LPDDLVGMRTCSVREAQSFCVLMWYPQNRLNRRQDIELARHLSGRHLTNDFLLNAHSVLEAADPKTARIARRGGGQSRETIHIHVSPVRERTRRAIFIENLTQTIFS